MSPVAPPNLLTVREAAELVGLSQDTIRRYVRDGRLTGYQVGRRALRLDPREVRGLIVTVGGDAA